MRAYLYLFIVAAALGKWTGPTQAEDILPAEPLRGSIDAAEERTPIMKLAALSMISHGGFDDEEITFEPVDPIEERRELGALSSQQRLPEQFIPLIPSASPSLAIYTGGVAAIGSSLEVLGTR